MNKEDLIKSIKELGDELGETKGIEISDEAEVVEDEGE